MNETGTFEKNKGNERENKNEKRKEYHTKHFLIVSLSFNFHQCIDPVESIAS
jgi:hypothetical protein